MALLGAVVAFGIDPATFLGATTLVMLCAAAVYLPTVAVAAYAVVVVTNAAAVATDFHGAPPIGGLLVPSLLALLFLRRAAGLEDLGTSVYLLVPAGLYLSTNALGLLWVQDPSPTISKVSELVKNLAIVFVLCGFLTTRKRFRAVVYSTGAAAVGLASISAFQYMTGTFGSAYFGFATASVKNIFGTVDSWRLQGPLGDPNYFAQLLVMTLPVVIVMAFVARPIILRIACIFGAPIIILTTFLTYSRGALVSLVGLAIVTILLSRQRVPIVLGVAVAAIVVLFVAPDTVFSRVQQIVDGLESVLGGSQAVSDPAMAQRLSVMRAGAAMIENNPMLGIGAGQFQYAYADFALANGLDLGAPAQAHNSYLELAAEQGIVGVLISAGLIFSLLGVGTAAIWKFRNSGYKTEGAIVFGLLLGMMGYLMTAFFLHDDYTRVFWLFASLLISAYATSSRIGLVDED